MNAQENNISIGPKNFNNSIGVKIDLQKNVNVTIKLFDKSNVEVTKFIYKDTNANFFKLNMDALSSDATYEVKVYVNEELEGVKEVYKNPKQ